MNDLLATVAFALIVAGWTQRRRRARHVPLVLAGIGLDLGLVVYLELTGRVVEKVAGTVEHTHFSWIRWVHIWSSTLAVVFYLPTLWYGFRMLKGSAAPAVRKRHAVFSTLALALRTVGFVCMWGVEAAKP